MDEADWLALRFEEQRAHLRAVAYRMLGSLAEADDAVQNSWLRLSRADAAEVENLAGAAARSPWPTQRLSRRWATTTSATPQPRPCWPTRSAQR